MCFSKTTVKWPKSGSKKRDLLVKTSQLSTFAKTAFCVKKKRLYEQLCKNIDQTALKVPGTKILIPQFRSLKEQSWL